MIDVTAIGEVLIDFTPSGKNSEGVNLYAQNPGGAPGNVLALLAKLGKKTAMISKVGKDQFGNYLIDIFQNAGVDTAGIFQSDEANTTLAFVHLDKKGDRSFSFFRNNSADTLLSKNDIQSIPLSQSKVFHFGSVSLTTEPVRSATFFAVEKAKAQGSFISYDPNLRPLLWKNLEEAKKIILQGLQFCDILKISEEELEFLTGFTEIEKGVKQIKAEFDIPIILITLGPKGAFYNFYDKTGFAPTYDVQTIDTTGAGDAFLGGILYQFIEHNCNFEHLNDTQIQRIINFANATGSLATTKKGAIPAMPTLDEIENCLISQSLIDFK
ncbi:MAG: carbohydrate kinase family protein [Treponemataceae bacterium]